MAHALLIMRRGIAITMIKRLLKILTLISLYLGLSLSTASCMRVDSSSTVDGSLGISSMDSSGTYSFPVTIAKLIYPIDTDSVAATLNVTTEELIDGSITDPDEIIGTITGATLDAATTTIGVMVDGAYVDSVAVENGNFIYELPYQYFEKSVRFFVLGEDTTISNGGNVSEPVTITFATVTNADGTITVTVTIEGPVINSATGEISSATTTRTETVPTADDESEVIEPDPTQNQAPEASDIVLNIGLDFLGRVSPNPIQSLPVNFSATDADGDTLTYDIVTPPTHGFIETIDGVLMYVPQFPFANDSFTYMANDGTDDSNEATITIANSAVSDVALENQSFNSAGVVFMGKAGTFAETNGPQTMTVAYNPHLKMYVGYFDNKFANGDALCPGGYWQVGRATSADGLNWVQDNDPILAPLPGSNHSCGPRNPAVVFDGVQWFLFFTMNKVGGISGLGLSVSQNSTSFSAPTKIVDANTVDVPSAVFMNGKLIVYYLAQNGQTTSIDRIFSDDFGATWSLNNQQTGLISTAGAWAQGTPFANTQIQTHSVVTHSNDLVAPYKMVIVGIPQPVLGVIGTPIGGLLESADGVTWTLSDDLPIVTNPAWFSHPEILLHGNNYLLWYPTLENNKSVVNFATTYANWPQ